MRFAAASRPKVVTKTTTPNGMFQSPMNVESESRKARFSPKCDVPVAIRNVRFTSIQDVAQMSQTRNERTFRDGFESRQFASNEESD
jgi:hypothetical protein